jgi:hypothetical protein
MCVCVCDCDDMRMDLCVYSLIHIQGVVFGIAAKIMLAVYQADEEGGGDAGTDPATPGF